jgi:hypothetical protein
MLSTCQKAAFPPSHASAKFVPRAVDARRLSAVICRMQCAFEVPNRPLPTTEQVPHTGVTTGFIGFGRLKVKACGGTDLFRFAVALVDL